MAWCQKCYDRMAAKWARKAGYNPNHKLDTTKMVFPCQVPVYDPDYLGMPRMRIYNCEKDMNEYYTIEEYRFKKSQGLLP